jgi:hypothetical protein
MDPLPSLRQAITQEHPTALTVEVRLVAQEGQAPEEMPPQAPGQATQAVVGVALEPAGLRFLPLAIREAQERAGASYPQACLQK